MNQDEQYRLWSRAKHIVAELEARAGESVSNAVDDPTMDTDTSSQLKMLLATAALAVAALDSVQKMSDEEDFRIYMRSRIEQELNKHIQRARALFNDCRTFVKRQVPASGQNHLAIGDAIGMWFVSWYYWTDPKQLDEDQIAEARALGSTWAHGWDVWWAADNGAD